MERLLTQSINPDIAIVAALAPHRAVVTAYNQQSLMYMLEETGLQYACLWGNMSAGQRGRGLYSCFSMIQDN